MPGKIGVACAKPRKGSVQHKIWQSMRILRRFTIPELCKTASARQNNVKKFVRNLTVRGYVIKYGHYVSGSVGASGLMSGRVDMKSIDNR